MQNKTYPLNSAPRGDNGQIVSGFRNILDLETKSDKRRKLITIQNISESDKVVLSEVTEKWSMNKNVIDPDTNKRSVNIVKEVMNNLEIFSNDKFYVKNVENVYVMKDKKETTEQLLALLFMILKIIIQLRLLLMQFTLKIYYTLIT